MRNLREIREAIKIPQIYRTILFLLLTGIVSPSFGTMFYYFNINEIKFAKSTISLFTVIGYVTLLIGTTVYHKFLKDKEIRTLLKFAILISYIGTLSSLIFILRLNLKMHINDVVFIVFTSVITDTL